MKTYIVTITIRDILCPDCQSSPPKEWIHTMPEVLIINTRMGMPCHDCKCPPPQEWTHHVIIFF